ncbi:MAG TPA: metallophosphoesterase [Candidatus Paceibacterota bacterium]|nr:metallophosphoesterase [Candidatus Paceibacterota bacterium]
MNNKSEKFKILAAGDIHGDSRLTKRLAERAIKENVDLVILTGDLTFIEQSTKNIIGPFAKANKKVLLIPGNHETIATADFLSEVYPNTKNIHGYAVHFGDIGIFGAGGANIGPFTHLRESELYGLLSQGFDKVKNSKVKIMVTHVHPANSKIEKFTNFFKGSGGVEKAIKRFKPDIALCSHVHEAGGIEEKVGNTRLIDVGRDGVIIEI